MRTDKNPAPRCKREPGYQITSPTLDQGITASTIRRPPPYAHKVRARLAAHTGPLMAVDLRIFTGARAWQEAKDWLLHDRRKIILCLPPGNDPGAYDWRLAADCEPWILETGHSPNVVLERLALALLDVGCRVVRLSYWDSSGRRMDLFKADGVVTWDGATYHG